MKFLITAVLLFIACEVSAQTPYWQPVDGPFEFITNLAEIDSMTVTKIGANYYSYDAPTQSWKIFDYQRPRQITWPNTQHKAVASGAVLRNDTAYFSSLDSVFFSSDFGFDWKYIGSFGSPIVNSVKSIFELPSGITVIQNSLGTLYFSHNAFQTYDTGHVLSTASLKTNGDTLFYVEQRGNMFRSTDIGNHWDALVAINDTSASNRWSLTIFPAVYVLRDLKGLVEYSRDGGLTFTKMRTPSDSTLNVLSFAEGRFYAYFYPLSGGTPAPYRSDDWGQTWKQIAFYPQIVEPNGVLYFYSSRSSDYGDTWNTINARGLIGTPGSMDTWHDTTYLSTDQGIYRSADHGINWTKFASDSGILSHAHGDTLTVNTISLLMPGGYLKGRLGFNIKKPNIGAVMDSGVIWVRDQGRLYGSLDAGASFYAFDPDAGRDMANILILSADTALVVYSHAIWKVKDIVTGVKLTLPTTAMPTGALCEDSSKAIYIGLNDGTLLVSHDRTSTWQSFPSPVTASNTIVTALAAGRPGVLWAITKDTIASRMRTYRYDSIAKSWSDVTTSIQQTDTTVLTNLWYVNDYVYVGTSDNGLYRSVKSSHAAVHYSPEEQRAISLNPNPVSQNLVISYDPSERGSVSVVDLTGHEVMCESLPRDRSEMTLDCSALPAGMYVARINGEHPQRMKFVKQ